MAKKTSKSKSNKRKSKASSTRRRPTLQQALLAAGGHGDQRFPTPDPNYEILCKWVGNRTVCKQVPTGGNW